MILIPIVNVKQLDIYISLKNVDTDLVLGSLKPTYVKCVESLSITE